MNINRVKADMKRAMEPLEFGSNPSDHRDYEFERRASDMKRLGSALEHFDSAVMRGMIAMKEIASAYEAVGQAFTEMTIGNVETSVDSYVPESHAANTTAMENEDSGHLANDVGAVSATSTKLPEETTSQIRRLARMFAEEARKMNEGQPFQTFNTGVHHDVITRLRPVTEHLKAVDIIRRDRTATLNRYNKYKSQVERVEKKYAKKGKPFCDSKSHKKYAAKRDETWKEYQAKKEKFNDSFSFLMEVNDHAAASIIYRYLSLNNEYLRQLGESISRVLPAMEEAYPLNSEYSSIQNTLLVEAVAAAKSPFAKHYKQAEKEEEEEEEEEDEEETSLTETSTAQRGSISGKLEEPEADEAPAKRTKGQPVESAENPHEPVHQDKHSDPVRDATHSTNEDHMHKMTQSKRLVKGETDSPAKPKRDVPSFSPAPSANNREPVVLNSGSSFPPRRSPPERKPSNSSKRYVAVKTHQKKKEN
ncbi:hypothetical protein AGDE_09986 [Angomonas deanei]|uniref:BAR domain containing protein n=1 Tax=Angomonas deanei TaxID=59799 RepID=A0A7G2CB88_9TRYP|nr:hypothetical protein AGDE_09986 [Angomonas deanei]CAD2217076.1 hypothetical protein, conserved [Angomonas deanei]|eukprot:EPY29377.1 hypothetical protein AGDE_09986 [Angomonas deanei]